MLTRRSLPTLFNDRDLKPTRFSEWMDEIVDEMTNMNRDRFIPKMDVAETDQAFEVTVALPGMNKKDIEIELENDILTVKGERKWEKEDKNGRQYHRVETGYGQFSRSLPLPNIVDNENIQAEFQNGELRVTVPKSKENAAKKIEIS